METVIRKTCRLCGSGKMSEIISLGDQYINDFVPLERVGKGLKAPLDLVMCDRCSLLQLRHTAPQELLYSRYYWYRSGVTDTMRKALQNITSEIESMVPLREGDVVLDIGANDGTLLATYTTPGIRKMGCEPANNLVDELRKNTEYVMHDFWSYERYMELSANWGFGKAKVITAIGMFYDLEDPNKFIADARKALTDDGIFVAQLMCLTPMLQKNDLGNICHGHFRRCQCALRKRHPPVGQVFDRRNAHNLCKARGECRSRHADFAGKGHQRPWLFGVGMHDAQRAPDLCVREARQQAPVSFADQGRTIAQRLHQYHLQQTIQNQRATRSVGNRFVAQRR